MNFLEGMMGLDAMHKPLVNGPGYYVLAPPSNLSTDKQEGSVHKISACWHTVMKWLNPYVEYSLISDRFESLNRVQQEFDCLLLLEDRLKKTYGLSQIDKEEARKFLPKLAPEDQAVFAAFETQSLTDNFSEFAALSMFRKRKRIEKAFFSAVHGLERKKVNPCIRELYRNTGQRLLGKPWNRLSLFEKSKVLQAFSLADCSACFGLHKSSWNFHKQTQDLVDEIKSKGPLMVQGYFGRPFYQNDPHRAENVGGQWIYEWDPGTRAIGKIQNEFHWILVIGAKSEISDGLVYYVDPLDHFSSKPEENNMYRMTYSEFVESIATLEGIKAEKEWITPHATNFAWYGPFKKDDGYLTCIQVYWFLLRFYLILRFWMSNAF